MPPEWWSAVTPAPPRAPAAPPGGGDAESIIREVAGRYNFTDPDLLIATARQESGLNPQAVGDQGQSYGVFQEHSRGRGAGIPVQSRQDVAAATERAIREFNAIRAKNPAADRGTWAALAQRPLDAQGYARSVNALLGSPPAAQATRTATASPPTPSGPPPATAGPAPAWWTAVPGAASAGGAPGATAAPGSPGTLGETPAKQAVAASWALSNMGSKAFYDACQRFIENAYGTGGQYRSAAAAGKALFKTADPAEADVGDLVFFRPDQTNGYAGHAAIYLGNGEMVGATNAGVTKDNLLTNPYWKNLLVGFGDPPEAWKGRASSGDLMKGAGQLVGNAKAAVQGTAQGAAQAAPAWWGAVTGRR